MYMYFIMYYILYIKLYIILYIIIYIWKNNVDSRKTLSNQSG